VEKFIRLFLAFSLVIILLYGFMGCKSAPENFKWRMAASWTADHLFYTRAAQAICDRVKTLSGGRLVIQPYPAGEIAGALEVMEAVSSGKVEMGHSWPGYWTGKDPSFELFSSIPNQMVAQEWLVWLYGPSRGIELWRELYAGYNIVPFPGGLVGPEFGFFTAKPVRTLDDFRGLRLRVSGLASEVLKELGASTVLTAPGDIKAAMQKGEIDGFEFSTPAIDWPMGFQEIAPYISLPSWHQPSASNEAIVNREAYNKLPADLQGILEAACKEVAMVDYFAAMEGANSEYLVKYEQYGTQINVLDAKAVQKISEITNRLAGFYARVLSSQRDFVTSYRKWEAWGDQDLFANQSAAGKILARVNQNLTAEMTRLQHDMASAAEKLAGPDLAGKEARDLLSALLPDRPFVIDAYTIDRNGRIVALEPAGYRHFEGSDLSQEEQLTSAFRTQQPVLSSVFRADEGFEAVELIYPVLSSTGGLKGAVGAFIKPEVLLGDIITSAVKDTDYTIWAMQTDGRIVYDIDPQEIGRNLFVDPLYQPFPQLIALGKEISVAKSGSGQYQFLDTGMQKTVNKAAEWITFEMQGTEWRLVLIHVVS
jgi:TRAP-type mannitol/chloroaromatic compound transport system substrate-binding protein